MAEQAFVFALCAQGAERALKEEVARRRLLWKPSYQRSGFVTFKVEDDALPELVFARERSVSLGRVDTVPSGLDCYRVSPALPELEEAARSWAHKLEPPPRAPRPGETVGEVVVVGPDEVWLGTHVHDRTHSIHPGGWFPEVLPPEAPSRAYLKLEAVLAWFGLQPRAGEHAVELGSAPGGACWALLTRGLDVTGIDPAEMDPRVGSHPSFVHLKRSVTGLAPEDLPRRIDWLLADMNVSPSVTLRRTRPLVAHARPRFLIVTLKLKEWSVARALSDWVAEVHRWGYRRVFAQQLSVHRQELALVAWRDP